ncbi:glycoside hydrolase family 30 protein [Clostridium butyricum]|uniref:glycoside hydrolase family 30 protein n=1 Tax=Clostridium butyricum TaxID=1492 RepID=UPI0024BAE8D3|nr:glycoside hydrolase family 30 beta sandwich domain-containing protein [Clostridium butyricum]
MKKYNVYETYKDGKEKLELKKLDDIALRSESNHNACIKVNTGNKFQNILGFGGALTESSSYALSKLDDDVRKKVLKSYYDKEEGIGYKFGRIHINSCDFSLENYTYVEENDLTLNTFTLERDEKYVLPLVREVKEISEGDLTILASPWSPPSYMKTNGEMNHGGKLKEECKQLWADYYVKYIEKMKEKDIDIWAVTVQNEPAAIQTWDSCEYTAEEERDFVKYYLGPTFHKNNLQDKKIIIWDHNRDIAYERAKVVLEDEEAAKYVYGTGLHWYVSEEFANVSKIHTEFPDKHLIFTEGCQEGGVHLGSWDTGERYGRNIIGDFNNYMEAWMDWNIALDETGGPNHVGNLCDSPVIIDTKEKNVIYNSSFYYIAHFSKFIKENAIRVESTVECEKVYCLSCINEDNTICSVIMNESDDIKIVDLEIDGDKVSLQLKPHSIYTIKEVK